MNCVFPSELMQIDTGSTNTYINNFNNFINNDNRSKNNNSTSQPQILIAYTTPGVQFVLRKPKRKISVGAMATSQSHELRIGSYLRSKADTDESLSWLLGAAMAAGYNIPASHSNLSSELPSSASQHQEQPKTTQTFGEKLREN